MRRYKNILKKKKNPYKKYKIKTSKLESRFAVMLRQWGIKYDRQFKIDSKYYDFYLPKYDLVIEVMGDYYHGNTKFYESKDLSTMQFKNKINDIYKKNLAISRGHSYIDLWE